MLFTQQPLIHYKSILLSLLFLLNYSNVQSQTPQFWAALASGGMGSGTIIHTDTNGTNPEVNFRFQEGDMGRFPLHVKLCKASNGKYYGTTQLGGEFDYGTIFEFDPITNVYEKKFDFDDTIGNRPRGSLIQASNGKLYGMTSIGGVNGKGTIYEYDLTQNLIIKIHDFSILNGMVPYGDLIEASNGKLYGMTPYGGQNSKGVIFEMDLTTYVYSKLYDFITLTGATPNGSLLQANNGKLYGLTADGGVSNYGTIFEFNILTGTYTKLYDFSPSLGMNPKGSLIQGSDNKLYGLTNEGGGYGVIFNYNLNTNIYTKLYGFDILNGKYPYGDLIEGSNGVFYGTTSEGGTSGNGVLFKFQTSANIFTKLHDFDNINGKKPIGTLIKNSMGDLYGLTQEGGEVYNFGVLFKYDFIGNNFVNLHAFQNKNGYLPFGSITQANNENLYGMTTSGGAFNHGVIYEFEVSSYTYKKLFDFDGINGGSPIGALIQASNGKLYGYAQAGIGTYVSTLFEFDLSNNNYTRVHDFIGPTAGAGFGELVEASNGKLYGIAGGYNTGFIFEFDLSNGILTLKKQLNTIGGIESRGSLIQASNGKLYGTTLGGGTIGRGLIFEYNIVTDTLIKILDFNGANGRHPDGALKEGTDGNLYGTTTMGGLSNKGVLFSINPSNHVYTKIIDFNGLNGEDPIGYLLQGSNGKLYGFTTSGGTYGGVLYEYDPFTSAFSLPTLLSYQIGAHPYYNYLIETNVCLNTSYRFADTACGTYVVPSGDETYFTIGNQTVFDTIPNVCGSDSILTIDITILPVSYGTDIVTACDSFLWIDGIIYTTSTTTATDTLVNQFGCDSLVTLNLTILNSSYKVDSIESCNSITWLDGVTYSSNNDTATYVITNSEGCDSVITLNFTINSNSIIDSIQSCDSIIWIDGITYHTSNSNAYFTLTNSLGCDSIVYLNYTNNSNSGIDIVVACDSFTWINGTTYFSTTNLPTWTLSNSFGCDSIVTLNLLIYVDSITESVVACDSFTWINGVTYFNNNNTESHVLTNINGCTNIVFLDLTILHSSNSTDSISACESYTWIDGNTYTSHNNSASFLLSNSLGCDSTITLDLKIKNSSNSIDFITDCDSYTWIDGITYTTNNNSATYILQNIEGCDSIITLNLTVNNSTVGVTIDSVTTCDSYTWIDGNTYSTSTNFPTWIYTNIAGCDSIIQLSLTINNSANTIDLVNACDSFTWINGVTYFGNNSSATHTLLTSKGCDSIVTLNLFLNSNVGTDVITACDSFTWVDGITYFQDNDSATFLMTNTAGCDSLITLNLTIKNSSSSSTTDVIVACDSIIWIDGNTYSSNNNTSTYNLSNQSGCDSMIVLDLTILNSTSSTEVVSSCNSYTWIDGVTYTISTNNPIWIVQNSSGCDSIISLNLTIQSIDVTVNQNGLTLQANNSGADYQWLDCINNFSAISNETNQTLLANQNGQYAVEITENNCIDTSFCLSINNVGIFQQSFESSISISPNPFKDKVKIILNQNEQMLYITLYNSIGQLIQSKTLQPKDDKTIEIQGDRGIYILKISNSEGLNARFKIIKN